MKFPLKLFVFPMFLACTLFAKAPGNTPLLNSANFVGNFDSLKESLNDVATQVSQSKAEYDSLNAKTSILSAHLEVINKKSLVDYIVIIIPAFAALVALFGFFQSRRYFNRTMEHYRNSFRPILFTKADFRNTNDNGIYLINVGNGPAKINEFKIFIDGKEIDESFDNIANMYAEKLRIHAPFISATYFERGHWFGKNEMKPLFIMDKRGFQPEVIQALSNRVSFFIKYESLWGDQYENIFSRQKDFTVLEEKQ